MWRRFSPVKRRQLHIRTVNVFIVVFCLIVMLLGYQYGSYFNYTRGKKRLTRVPDDVINTDFPWMPLDQDLTSTLNRNKSMDTNAQNVSILARDLQFQWEGESIIEWDKLNPKLSIVNKFERPYVIEPRDICENSPFLVILVFSVHSHGNIRDAIRRTWGSIVNGNTWPGNSLKVDVKLLFLFGRPSSPEMEYIVKMESKTFKDILQGDFVDVYNNLTLKSLMGLRFLLQYCPGLDYVMKADEDTFTNIPLLVQFLQLHVPSRAVIGHIYTMGSRVHRLGKWKVDSSVYPMQEYPRYAAGNAYVLSADLLPCLVNSSHYIPYMPIEDVHVTGIAAALCSARHLHVHGFTYWSELAPSVCDIVHGRQITANRVRAEMALDVWKSIMGYPCE